MATPGAYLSLGNDSMSVTFKKLQKDTKVLVGKCDARKRRRRERGPERVKAVQCVREADISCALLSQHRVGGVLEDANKDIGSSCAPPPLRLALVV